MKSKVGRPTKYKPKTVRAICEAISDGVPHKFAARLGGISYETFCEWRREYLEFSQAVEGALAKGIQTRLQRITAAGKNGNTKSDQWWLQNVVPEHFGRDRVDEQEQDISPAPPSFEETPQPWPQTVTTESDVPTFVIQNALKRFIALNPQEIDNLARGVDRGGKR